MLIQGIYNSAKVLSYNDDGTCHTVPSNAAQSFAIHLSQQWLYSNYISFNQSGFMMEKYYAPVFGAGTGVGDEYVPQTGFGWTNGCALSLIQQYNQYLNFTRFVGN